MKKSRWILFGVALIFLLAYAEADELTIGIINNEICMINNPISGSCFYYIPLTSGNQGGGGGGSSPYFDNLTISLVCDYFKYYLSTKQNYTLNVSDFQYISKLIFKEKALTITIEDLKNIINKCPNFEINQKLFSLIDLSTYPKVTLGLLIFLLIFLLIVIIISSSSYKNKNVLILFKKKKDDSSK